MELHQLLRFVTDGCAILLFDLKGRNICKTRSKHNIPINLYEYLVLEITVGSDDLYNKALYITLEK